MPQDAKSSYWISHHGALLLVASEHLRPAAMEERLANGVVAEMLGHLAEQLQDSAPAYHDLRPEGVAVPPAVIPEDTAEVAERMARARGAAEEPDSGPPAPPTPERHPDPVGVEEPVADLETVAEEPEQGHGEAVDAAGAPSSRDLFDMSTFTVENRCTTCGCWS